VAFSPFTISDDGSGLLDAKVQVHIRHIDQA
jgi:hypothetical protein